MLSILNKRNEGFSFVNSCGVLRYAQRFRVETGPTDSGTLRNACFVIVPFGLSTIPSH